jgi:hypothetical protein
MSVGLDGLEQRIFSLHDQCPSLLRGSELFLCAMDPFGSLAKVIFQKKKNSKVPKIK